MTRSILLPKPGVLACVLGLLCVFCGSTEAQSVSCWYTNWSQYRPGAGRFTIPNIDPSLCTDLIFAFATITGTDVQKYEYNDEQAWQQLNGLKQTYPKLRTFLSVGGASVGSLPFSNVISTKEKRTAFISSTISLLRTYRFSGLDIDWEYPSSAYKQNFTILLQEMQAAFLSEAIASNTARLLLSLSVAAGKWRIDDGYDIPAMDSVVDRWNLMTYDYHGSWESTTNLATPLYDRGDTFSVNFTVMYYLSKGASREKINVGLAFYGRTWAVSGSNAEIGAPANGPGSAGSYTKTSGFLAYYEVCLDIQSNGLVPRYENTYGYVKYASNSSIYVTYEDVESLEEKMKYIKQNSLGGAMIFTLDYDDFSGQFCGQGAYPLTKLVASRMFATSSSSTTVTTSQTTSASTTSITRTSTSYPTSTTGATSSYRNSTTSPTAALVNETFQCPVVNGMYPDRNCSVYNVCVNQTLTRIQCPTNTIYNPNTKRCEIQTSTTYVCPNQTNQSTTSTQSTASSTPSTTSTTQSTTSTTQSTTSTTPSTTSTTPSTTSTTQSTTSTTPSTTSTTQSTSTVPSNFTCPLVNGVYADKNCSVYNICTNQTLTRIQCPTNTIFNPNTKRCESQTNTTYTCPNETLTTAFAITQTQPTLAGSSQTTTASSASQSTPTPSQSTLSTAQPTSTVPATFSCPSRYGIFADKNCFCYNVCVNQVPMRIRCPIGTIFNSSSKKCENIATTTFSCPS